MKKLGEKEKAFDFSESLSRVPDGALTLFLELSMNSATAAASRELMRESRSRTRNAST